MQKLIVPVSLVLVASRPPRRRRSRPSSGLTRWPGMRFRREWPLRA